MSFPVDNASLTVPRPRAPLSRICVALTGTTPEEFESASAALHPEFPFQELRLDFLHDPAAILPTLQSLLRSRPRTTFLATCRPVISGGHFSGSANQELEMLTLAAQAGCSLVDLSLESAETLGSHALAHLRKQGAHVLLSFHDFHGAPDLAALLARMRALRPDLYKIVATAQILPDSLDLLAFLRAGTLTLAEPLVALSMGEAGVLTRILGPRFGSAFTFAAPSAAQATAPGQLTARTLSDLYRLDRITSKTALYAVAGDPIHSSLSPLMQNTAFRAADLDAVYVPLQTASAEDLFRAARELPMEGFSVTMPLKQAVAPFLDHINPLAARIGAVNTVHRTPDGHFHGANTDAAGITVPLERRPRCARLCTQSHPRRRPPARTPVRRGRPVPRGPAH
jgi:3-dehydroquinate dehydratase/shikimate dehydrogenase